MSVELVSTNLDAVKCVIGQSTKKDNTITMKVDSKVIIEAVELYDSMKKGIKPTSGIIGFRLSAVYADAEPIEIEVEQ